MMGCEPLSRGKRRRTRRRKKKESHPRRQRAMAMGVAERPNGRERARQRDSGRFFDGPWQVQGFGAIMSRANVEGCDAWACLSNSRAWAWAWEACAAAAHKMQAGGQTSNGACVDLVCETGRSVLSWCTSSLVGTGHRSDLQAPARSLRAGPAISVLCAVHPLPSFALPSRDPP